MTDFKVVEGDVTLYDGNGAETGVAANPVRVDPTGDTAQPVNQGAAGTEPWPVSGDPESPTLQANYEMMGNMLKELQRIRVLLEILTDEKVHEHDLETRD